MEINAIILRTGDLDAARSFWSEKVGLRVAAEGPDMVFLDGGSVQLILSKLGNSEHDESLTEVVFNADDVIAAFDELSNRGVPFEVEPRAITSDGDRDLLAAHFRDPDGHYGTLTGWVSSGRS